MGKPIGSPKTGGRKKGTPNVRTLDLLTILEQYGVDPLGEILTACEGLPKRDKIKIYLEILPYLYPKRKVVEATPLTLENQIDRLSMPQMAKLYNDLSMRMGNGKELTELNLEQLEAYKESIDKLLLSRKALDALSDDEYC